jgi:translation initiation factor 2 gamma subunit (eIF-2gamma)
MNAEDSTPQPAALLTLKAELAVILKGVTDCFEVTNKIDFVRDEYGHRRAREIENAVTLLKVSADLGLAIAKIKGEYNHNINVLHGEIWPPPRRSVPKPQTPEEGRPAPKQG